jgi:hypothetical protein
MLVSRGMAMGAAMDGVVRPLQSSSTTASCAGREKDEYRRNRSIRVVGLCSAVETAISRSVVVEGGFGCELRGLSHASSRAERVPSSLLASAARPPPGLEKRRVMNADNRLMAAWCVQREIIKGERERATETLKKLPQLPAAQVAVAAMACEHLATAIATKSLDQTMFMLLRKTRTEATPHTSISGCSCDISSSSTVRFHFRKQGRREPRGLREVKKRRPAAKQQLKVESKGTALGIQQQLVRVVASAGSLRRRLRPQELDAVRAIASGMYRLLPQKVQTTFKLRLQAWFGCSDTTRYNINCSPERTLGRVNVTRQTTHVNSRRPVSHVVDRNYVNILDAASTLHKCGLLRRNCGCLAKAHFPDPWL